MDDWLPAYAAGLIDGEGSISISRSSPQPNTTSPLPRLRLIVTVKMVDRSGVDLLHVRWGGSIIPVRATKPNHRDCVQWTVQALKARTLLLDILPFLAVKKSHAQVAIAFQDDLIESGRHRYAGQGFQRHSTEVISVRMAHYEAMRRLNLRGQAAL